MTASTFPNAYYSTLATKLTGTSATSILALSSVSAGRRTTLNPVQVKIANEDAGNTCIYTLEFFDGSTSFRIQKATLAADANTSIDLTGMTLIEGEELRLTAQNANDLVAVVNYMQTTGVEDGK